MNAKGANRFMFFMLLYQITVSFILQVMLTLPGVSLPLWQLLIVNEAICFIIPSGFYLLSSKRNFSDIFPIKPLSFTNILLIFFMMITFQPLMMFLSALSMFFFQNNVADVMQNIYTIPLPLLLITLGVTPAICEEAAFRGVIQSGFHKLPFWQAALLNGFLFGLMHLDPQQFLYAFVLGAIFYLLVRYTGSILASVLAHFTVNSTQALLAYFSLRYLSTAQQAEVITELPINEHLEALLSAGIFALLSAPLLIFLFYLFIKHNGRRCNSEILNEQTDKPLDIYFILTVVLYIVFVVFNL